MTPEEFREIVGIAIGEASVAWSELPKGVFNWDKSVELIDRIVDACESRRDDDA